MFNEFNFFGNDSESLSRSALNKEYYFFRVKGYVISDSPKKFMDDI